MVLTNLPLRLPCPMPKRIRRLPPPELLVLGADGRRELQDLIDNCERILRAMARGLPLEVLGQDRMERVAVRFRILSRKPAQILAEALQLQAAQPPLAELDDPYGEEL